MTTYQIKLALFIRANEDRNGGFGGQLVTTRRSVPVVDTRHLKPGGMQAIRVGR
jgi:hypothetical protein